MIFQDPLSALHPLYKVGKQLIEALAAAQRRSRKAKARERAIELLGLVGIPDPKRRVDEYPHEFSGGMRQRAMIAMALANDPKLLIADEPTTALDVTVQAQILALMERLQSELGMAIVIITHDLGVVAELADDIAVMYAGRIVETASAETIFSNPQHPYTWGLLKSIPRLESDRSEMLVPIPRHAALADQAAVGLSLPPALRLRAAGPRAHRPGSSSRSRANRATSSPACSSPRSAGGCGRSCAPAGPRAGARRGRRGGGLVMADPDVQVAPGAERCRVRPATVGGPTARRGARPRQALPDHARRVPAAAASAR